MTEPRPGHANALAYVQGNFVPALPAEYADWLLDLVDMARANPGTGAQQLTVPPAVTATGRLPKAAVPQEDGSFVITLYSALASLHLEYELEPEQPTEHDDDSDLPAAVPNMEISINRLMYLLRTLAVNEATQEEKDEARALHATFSRLEHATYATADDTATPEHSEALQPVEQAGGHLAANLKALGIHARLELRQSGALLMTADHTAAAALATWLDVCLANAPLADLLHANLPRHSSGQEMAQTIAEAIRYGTDYSIQDITQMLNQALPYERLDDLMNALHTLTGTVRPTTQGTRRGPAIND